MSDPQLAATISAIGSALGAFVAAIAAVVAAHIGHKNRQAIQEVHLSLNSRLDELLHAAHFRGQVEERDNQRAVEQRASLRADAVASGQVRERDEQRVLEERNEPLPPVL